MIEKIDHVHDVLAGRRKEQPDEIGLLHSLLIALVLILIVAVALFAQCTVSVSESQTEQVCLQAGNPPACCADLDNCK